MSTQQTTRQWRRLKYVTRPEGIANIYDYVDADGVIVGTVTELDTGEFHSTIQGERIASLGSYDDLKTAKEEIEVALFLASIEDAENSVEWGDIEQVTEQAASDFPKPKPEPKPLTFAEGLLLVGLVITSVSIVIVVGVNLIRWVVS